VGGEVRGAGGQQVPHPPDHGPPQAYGLWDHEDPFPKKKAEAERVEDEEEEERREEAASPPLAVGEEGTEASAEPGGPGTDVGLEPEGDAVGQEEGAGATQLRFRRKRRRGRKQPEAAPEEGEHQFLGSRGHGWHPLGRMRPCGTPAVTRAVPDSQGMGRRRRRKRRRRRRQSRATLRRS